MKMVSNLELIRRVPLFSMLSAEHAASVADSVTKRRFKRGEVLLEQGNTSIALLIILAGRVRVVCKGDCGREVIFVTLKAGEHLGEMSLIDDEPHSATVSAEIQTDVLVLGRLEFARCLPENSSMAYAVMKGLVQRLRHADRKIESLALMDVYGRVARALLEFSSEDKDGDVVIRDKVSRQDLAKMVGASREMVSRVMKDLEERGYVQTREDGSLLVQSHLGTLG